MLGTFGTSAYKNAEDFMTHKDYLNYMYGGVQGFVTRSVIPANKAGAYYETFNLNDRLINRNSYYDIENVYTSMNTFLSKRKEGDEKSGRKVDNLKKLNALYLDLDCYKIGMTQEQVLYELEYGDYFDSKIPVPTFVINSGRGLYLIWKINEDRNALPKWTQVENYLFEQCKEFNADPQALDAARILRVPYSKNSKNNTQVHIMRFTDVSYKLYDLIKEYDIKPKSVPKKAINEITYPYGEATAKQRRIAAWQASEFGVALPNFEDYQETFDFIKEHSNHREEIKEDNKVIHFAKAKTITAMLDGRCNDLFKLFSMRKGEDCSREYALFLCRLWYGERTNNFEYALEQTHALNRTFNVPFKDDYVEKRTKSAETKLKSGKTYQYSLKKLIEVLNITEEEQRELEYLCVNPQSEIARKKKSNRRAYLSRLEKEGKDIKSNAVSIRRQEVATLIAKGISKDDICAELNISSRTFDRDKAVITADGLLSRVKAVLEEKAKKITGTVDKAVKTLNTATEKVGSIVEKAAEMTQKVLSPFFQSTNYKRTPVGCSACASMALLSYLQLSLWDIVTDDDTGDSS